MWRFECRRGQSRRVQIICVRGRRGDGPRGAAWCPGGLGQPGRAAGPRAPVVFRFGVNFFKGSDRRRRGPPSGLLELPPRPEGLRGGCGSCCSVNWAAALPQTTGRFRLQFYGRRWSASRFFGRACDSKLLLSRGPRVRVCPAACRGLLSRQRSMAWSNRLPHARSGGFPRLIVSLPVARTRRHGINTSTVGQNPKHSPKPHPRPQPAPHLSNASQAVL